MSEPKLVSVTAADAARLPSGEVGVTVERFDYTEWQRDYFDRMPPETIREKALDYAEKHPYSGDPSKRL